MNGGMWLRIVTLARKTLRPEQYREWIFIVGNDGTEIERCRRGLDALEMITGRKPQVGPSEVKDASTRMG